MSLASVSGSSTVSWRVKVVKSPYRTFTWIVCAGILAPRELKLIGPNPVFGLLRALFFSGEDSK